jgi:hypothetical protein
MKPKNYLDGLGIPSKMFDGDPNYATAHAAFVHSALAPFRENPPTIVWLDPTKPKPSTDKLKPGHARATLDDPDTYAEVWDGKKWVSWTEFWGLEHE